MTCTHTHTHKYRWLCILVTARGKNSGYQRMILIWILGLKIIELYESTKACLSIVTMSYLPKNKNKKAQHSISKHQILCSFIICPSMHHNLFTCQIEPPPPFYQNFIMHLAGISHIIWLGYGGIWGVKDIFGSSCLNSSATCQNVKLRCFATITWKPYASFHVVRT